MNENPISNPQKPKKMSTSETGHLKNLTNFERLIAFTDSYGPAYAPSNPAITLKALRDSHDKCREKLDAVNNLKIPYSNAVGARRELYQTLNSLATRVIAALEVSGAGDSVIANARTVNHKLQGQRAESKGAADPAEATVSTSQQSFDRQADFLLQLINVLVAEPLYAPNEVELQPVSLTAFQEQLTEANTRVMAAYPPYSNGMITRDSTFYADGGLLDQAKKAKVYVKSVFGAQSPQYAQVRAISFKNIPK